MVRISMSLEPELLAAIDRFCRAAGFPSRSEAFREVMLDRLAAGAWLDGADAPCVTAVAVSYSARRQRQVAELLRHRQEHHRMVVACLQVSLTKARLLDVVVLNGKPADLKRFLHGLRQIKGIHFSEFKSPMLAAAP